MAALAMYYDGNHATGPMNLPRSAQPKLDGSGTVSNLAGADWATRNACGYYKAVQAVPMVGTVITAREWPAEPTDGVFTERILASMTEEDIEAARQRAELVALAGMAEQIGPDVAAIQSNLVDLGYSLPLDYSVVMADVRARSMGGQLDADQKDAMHDLGLLYVLLGSGLKDHGVADVDGTINAVWAYMGAQA